MAELTIVNETTAPSRELFVGFPDLNTVNESAEALNVCPKTVRRLIASGELPVVRVGRAVRITKRALVDYVNGREA